MYKIVCWLTWTLVALSHTMHGVVPQELWPAGYGSTHFIIGQPIYKKQHHIPPLSLFPDTIERILFSPDDDVGAYLLDLINKEQQHIRMTIYLLTDEQIMQALIAAHDRSVTIEIVVDPKHMYDRASRVHQLCQHGICVFVFNPKYSDLASTGLMHNKFVIFGSEHANAGIVWTGSFNFTKAAREYNQEHTVILRGTQVMHTFTKQFELLKERCVRYTTHSKSL